MNRRSKFFAAYGLPLAFVAAGLCAPRATFAAPPTDACALLTPKQVGSVLGVPVFAGGPVSLRTSKICGWPSPGGAVPLKRVTLNIVDVTMFAYAKMGIATKYAVRTPLNGVGDEAFYDTVFGLGTGLTVRKGDAVFSVRVYGFPVEQIMKKEKALALDVLARL